MKKCSDMLNKQIQVMHDRDWNKIYIAVDWHETMMPATYSNNDYGDYKLYKNAEEVLKWMSDCDTIVLILYTSSYTASVNEFLYNIKERYDIDFDYHNENPIIKNSETGDFSSKFYYSLMLDDKAGMDPLTDWLDLRNHIPEFNEMFNQIE